MTTDTQLPLYHRAIDWDALYRDYPVPDIYEETIYRWPADRIRMLQNDRFLTLMKHAWSNPFYQSLWGKAGVEPGDIRSLDDINKLFPLLVKRN